MALPYLPMRRRQKREQGMNSAWLFEKHTVEYSKGGTVAEDWFGDDPEGYAIPTSEVRGGPPM